MSGEKTKPAKPIYCPACAAAFGDDMELVGGPEADDPSPEAVAWDCCCDECGWSGDISPDLPLGEGE